MNQSTHDSDNNGPGMMIALILLLVLMAGYLGYLGIKNFLYAMGEKYTDVDPIVLPEVVATDPDVQEVLQRMDDFMSLVEANNAPAELTLSAQDINILINHHPDWSDLAGGLFVSIEGDEIHGIMSLEISGSIVGDGRYLNGNGIFRVGLLEGQPELYLESLELSGEPLPGFLMNKIRSANLLGGNEWDPDSQAFMPRMKTFQIEDGKLIMVVMPDKLNGTSSVPESTSGVEVSP